MNDMDLVKVVAALSGVPVYVFPKREEITIMADDAPEFCMSSELVIVPLGSANAFAGAEMFANKTAYGTMIKVSIPYLNYDGMPDILSLLLDHQVASDLTDSLMAVIGSPYSEAVDKMDKFVNVLTPLVEKPNEPGNTSN
jgi:hypothetical protein